MAPRYVRMKLASIALAIAIVALPAYASAQPAPNVPTPVAGEATLAISGNATIERDPDLARVSAEIVTNDDNATRSAGKNATIYETLKTKLASLGIGSDAIRTTSFNATFVPHPARALPPEASPPRYGFVTSRSLTIAVSPIGSAGKIVDASLAAGVTQIGDVSFELKDRKAAYREALAAALADAHASAFALLGKSEMKLVRVREISAGDYAFGPPRRFDGMQMRAAAMSPVPPTQIDPNGPIEVTAHVNVTYVIR